MYTILHVLNVHTNTSIQSAMHTLHIVQALVKVTVCTIKYVLNVQRNIRKQSTIYWMVVLYVFVSVHLSVMRPHFP